jgi:LuxR family quorum sensing-dependent transcriptional regulator
MSLADQVFEATAAFSRCEDVETLSKIFADRLGPLGQSVAACGMVTGAKAISGNPFFFVTWPNPWIALYTERDFVRKDPLPRWALVSGLPVTWSALKKRLPRNDPGQEVYRAAETWGYTEGMAVPVRSAVGELGLVTTGGRRGPFEPREEVFIQTLATAVFHRAVSLQGKVAPSPVVPLLSRREQEILGLLHHGFKDREIAKALEISIETVRSHLDNARLKVGARSRTELVSRTSGSVTGSAGQA